MNFKKIVFIAVLLLTYIFVYGQESSELARLIIFYSPSCHECIQVKNEFMSSIEKEFKGRIIIEYRDITDIENYKLMLSLQKKYNAKLSNALPILFFQGKFLAGKNQIEKELFGLINNSLVKTYEEKKQELPLIDLVAYFKTFKPLTIISAGLTDGINPCAFTVIVFFISFLALQGYRKRDLILIGVFFIFAVFFTYILIGIGLFGFIYQIRSLLIIAKIFNFCVGIFSFILGGIALYDAYKFKKTQNTEDLILQLPKAIKYRIQSLIGLHYRKTKELKNSLALKTHILRLIISALVTGFLVSILELVCTGQLYLPTITFILKTTHLKLQALIYLLLYNFMFIVPLLIVFFFALLGVTSEQFAKFLKRHLLSFKIFMAILFFGLGVFLIWKF